MSDIKRYDIELDSTPGNSVAYMEPYKDGEWVKYEDHLAVVAALTKLQQSIRRVRHYKGGTYTVDPIPVKMQVSKPDHSLWTSHDIENARIIQDGDEIIVYRLEDGSMAFGRFPDEMNDPDRFEDLS